MKSKFIQLATLFIFVMSVVYMVQTQNGYGHGASEHPPEFYVDPSGDPLTEDPDDCPCARDPRDVSDYSGSNGNGTGSASSWALRYYASPIISGNHDSDDEVNLVFGARLDFTASAGITSCSGSATPSITMDLGLTTDYTWGGPVRVLLIISDTKGHLPVIVEPLTNIPLVCMPVDLKGGTVDKTGEVKIRISDTDITDKQEGSIDVQLTSGSGSASGSYTVGSEVKRSEVHAYPYGFRCKLTPSFGTFAWILSHQMDKSAQTSGKMDPVDPDSIYAKFDGNHFCYTGGFD